MRFGGLWVAALCASCSVEEPQSFSADAKVETRDALVADLSVLRHPADGGGRAWLDGADAVSVVVGERRRFEILYEAGPLGIAEGGVLILQPSPFWGWDPPQMDRPDAPGYTEVSTASPAVELDLSVPAREFLQVRLAKGVLQEGDRVRIVYGAGPLGARVDRYAESGAPIWIAVDGDGDGVRAWLEDVPRIDVVAGAAARLIVTAPSTARPGETVSLTVAAVDALGNAGMGWDVPVRLSSAGLSELSEIVALDDRGVARLELTLARPGVYRFEASAAELEGTSNPMVVREEIPRIAWGDLHGHSQFSDGSGSPEDYFWYARDVAALDVVSLTDHDHWGVRFLDQTPEMWRAIREAAERFHDPGRFVTVLGYEWTSWIHGHRHVLYFDESGGEVLSSVDEAYETPARLWKALEGEDALTVAHHSAGGPVSTNWTFVPDPRIEPVTEVVSVHGASEAADAPTPIYSPVAGNFVRDVLDRGMQFGFIGSGDGHDGHPGLAHLGAPSGGLAAIFTEDLTRSGVLEALRNRSVYATNGPRIWLRVWLTEGLRFSVAGTAPIDRADIIRRGRPILSLRGEGRMEWSETIPLEPLGPGDYVYVRVVQQDGGAAWSSPFFYE